MIGTKVKKGQLKRHLGFSLIEIIVSVTLFSVIILSATNIFKLVIDSQRSAMAAQNVQENIKYFLEVIAKEIRMAQKNLGVCPGIQSDDVFAVTNISSDVQALSFKNYYGQCVTYALAADGSSQRFLISRDAQSGFISPAKISLDNLHFVVQSGTSTQSTVTINLRAHALGNAQFKSDMIIQTSIASRYYKN